MLNLPFASCPYSMSKPLFREGRNVKWTRPNQIRGKFKFLIALFTFQAELGAGERDGENDSRPPAACPAQSVSHSPHRFSLSSLNFLIFSIFKMIQLIQF